MSAASHTAYDTDGVWGDFIAPDPTLEAVDDLVAHMKLPIFSGHKAHFGLSQFRGIQPLFDAIMQRNHTFEQAYEDQCSARYYFDLYLALEAMRGQFNRVAEVGVFLGGASAVISGCCADMDFDLDLIDINPGFLRFSYERIRRTHPGAEKRVRMFLGGLPEYTAKALVGSPDKVIVHHDGAHSFEQVVKDMSALYFAGESVTAVIAQDTHLRVVSNNSILSTWRCIAYSAPILRTRLSARSTRLTTPP